MGGVLLLPPVQQDGEALGGLVDGPVKLRGEIVGPALLEPEMGVGVETVVGIETSDLRRITRPPDTERADAKLDGVPG